jgi:hypothetical protein
MRDPAFPDAHRMIPAGPAAANDARRGGAVIARHEGSGGG